jgi:AcrR family transcriptional regulator
MADSIGYRPAGGRGNEANGKRRDRFMKLAPGPGRSPDEVAVHQLTRLRRAMIEIVADEGYEAVTLRKLTKLASVSTQAFYRHFDSKEECLVETYEETVRGAARLVIGAARKEDQWESKLGARVRAFTEAVAKHPRSARLVLLEAFAPGFPARSRMRHTFGLSEAIAHDGFAPALGSTEADSLIIKGVVGGLITVTRARLVEGREQELPGLADELTAWMRCFAGVEVERLSPSPAGSDEARPARGPGRAAAVAEPPGEDRLLVLMAVRKLATTERLRELSAEKIRTAAGLSRGAYDAVFGSTLECLLATVDHVLDSIVADAERIRDASPDWARGVYRAILALCDELARDPSLARLGVTEALTLGPAAVRHRALLAKQLGENLRASAPADRRPTAVAGEASVGGALTILEHQAVSGGSGSLRRVAPAVAFVALAPVVGPAAAAATIQARQPALSGT